MYHNWIPFQISVADIKSEIEKAENIRVGRLGDDDFYIILQDLEVEILLCHERDVHVSFNKNNSITTDITKTWKERNIFLEQRQNKSS